MVDNLIGLEAIFDNEGFQSGISEYNRSVETATDETESAGSTMSKVWDGLASTGEFAFKAIAAGAAAAATAVGAAIGAITAVVFKAVDAAGELVDLSTKTGISVTNLQELQYVGDQVGTSLDTITGAQSRLIRSMSTANDAVNDFNQKLADGKSEDELNKNLNPVLEAFNSLGVVVRDSNGELRNQQDVFTEVIDALGKIENPAQRDALAMEIFGKSAQELNPLIKAGSEELARLADEAHNVGAVMSEDAVFALEAFGDTVGSIKAGLKGMLGTIAAQALPAIQSVAQGLQDLFKSEEFQKRLQEIGKAIGKIVTVIGDLAKYFIAVVQDGDTLNDWLSHLPKSIQPVVKAIADFVEILITGVPKAFQWLKDNKPIVIGILAAIGVALAAFAVDAVAAMIPVGAGLGVLTSPIVAIIAVVALLAKAWQEDWGGVQGKVAAAWAQIKPVFEKLQAWMKVNLPKALKGLSAFWENVLLPAIKTVFNWIVDNVLPILVKLVLWLGDNVPKAIQATSNFFTNTLLPALKTASDWIKNTLIPVLTQMRDWFQTHIVNGIKTLIDIVKGALTTALNGLSAIWKNVLLPAITAVYNFINNNIMPIFNALANLVDAVLNLALRVLAGIWSNILLPAIQGVYTFIGNIITAFNNIVTVVKGPLGAALESLSKMWGTVKEGIQTLWDKLEPFRAFLAGALLTAFNGIKSAVHDVVTWIQNLADGINNLTLPDWLTPGSPTPFEIGLVGINEQLKKLASASLPAIRQQMEVMATVREVPGIASAPSGNSVSNSSQSTRNYVYGANFNIPGPSGFIESLQGL